MSDSDADIEQRHLARMQRKKAVVDSHIAAAQVDRGVLLLLTGNGKGKSSSGFGMVARALGWGQQVGVVQFIKGAWATGEQKFAAGGCHPVVDGHLGSPLRQSFGRHEAGGTGADDGDMRRRSECHDRCIGKGREDPNLSRNAEKPRREMFPSR